LKKVGKLIGAKNELAIGIDFQSNDLKSTASRKNINTDVETKLDTRFPNGKNTMNNVGIYAQHVYKFKNKKLVLNDGLRLQSTSLKSNVEDNSFFKLPDTAVTQNNIALTGNIGVVYAPQKNTIFRAAISSGFRAPNIDDLSKIFESSTAAKQVVLPNANVKPEYTYNIDFSISQKIADKVTIDFTGFYTWFRNAIIKAPFTLNGQDSILYNGVKSQVLANQNVNKANLAGFSIGLQANIVKGLMFYSTLNYTYGRFKTDDTKKSSIYEKQINGTYTLVDKNVPSKPLDHIPPVIGKATLAYESKKFSTELNVLYNGWKRLENFNADGEDNAQYATADGVPAWATLNWKGNICVTKNVQLQLGIENIFDKNYRYFASGFSAGGRNYLVALRANW
jgi:hemoglobin/transferrin/lactoferrin receptor protein